VACKIEDNHGTYSFTVINAGHITEAFLSSDVPQLKSNDHILTDLYQLVRKVNTDSNFVFTIKDIVDVSLDEACLPNAKVSDNKNLEK
jgi:hypothetical protein